MIKENEILIDTTGEKVGQINGLCVMEMDDYTFGMPTRITASTYTGKAGIVNIEKEAEMSGSIHDKGVQVCIGYLGSKYAQNSHLHLAVEFVLNRVIMALTEIVLHQQKLIAYSLV